VSSQTTEALFLWLLYKRAVWIRN